MTGPWRNPAEESADPKDAEEKYEVPAHVTDAAFDYDDEDDCQTCGGEQIEECDDILGCFEAGCDGSYHRCPNCKGSGLAKDQWFW